MIIKKREKLKIIHEQKKRKGQTASDTKQNIGAIFVFKFSMYIDNNEIMKMLYPFKEKLWSNTR